MTTDNSVDQQRMSRSSSDRMGWYGLYVFAGTVMILLGAYHALLGVLALVQEDYFLVSEGGLMVSVDYSTWGWTHLILGVVVSVSGVALLVGAKWARVVAVICAVMSSLVNLAFLSAHPLTSGILIVLDILVIYAVTAHGDAARDRL